MAALLIWFVCDVNDIHELINVDMYSKHANDVFSGQINQKNSVGKTYAMHTHSHNIVIYIYRPHNAFEFICQYEEIRLKISKGLMNLRVHVNACVGPMVFAGLKLKTISNNTMDQN